VAAIVAVATCTSASTAYASGQMTQEEWDAVSYTTALFAMQHAPPTLVTGSGPRMNAPSWDVSTPSVVGAYVVTTLYESSTPCFNCVNGGEQGTFGSGDPLGYVNSSIGTLGLLWVWFDVSYTGSCTISVALTQGSTTLVSGSGTFSPSPGGVFDSLLKATRQSTWHGAALLVGKTVCGATTATSKGTVHFQ
jgi:hypothetical protein